MIKFIKKIFGEKSSNNENQDALKYNKSKKST